MPNIQSAKKKQKQDIVRTKRNTKYEKSIKKTMKEMMKVTKKGANKAMQQAYSLIDKAAKKKVIHKNKAATLKSRVSKLVKQAK